jgi:integrase
MSRRRRHSAGGAVLEKVRACQIEEWPTADRKAWERACTVGHRLKPGGTASRLRPSTRASLVRAYGYLFTFCRRNALFDLDAIVGGHVTPTIIDAFVDELRQRVGSVTRLVYIARIGRLTRILAPIRDLSWLREIEADLRYEARPRPKYHRIVPSDRLRALGLELISRGEISNNLTDLTRARLVRDGLMIAVLASCPIRLRNFAELHVGEQIRRIGDTWWIILSDAETKSGRPDERPVPDTLTPHIDRWLKCWQPLFRAPADVFWPSTKGGQLGYACMGAIITETTLRELGVAVSPHLFRDCAVYTVATIAGERMGIASGLLQHTDEYTIQKHYNKGAAISAVERYQKILNGMMGE